MSTAAARGFGLVGGIALLLPLSFAFPLVTPVPSRADVAPESGLFVHVQPVSGSCVTSISDCHEIVRSTPQDGELEFLLFFMVGTVGSGDCLESLHGVLTWPSAWQLLAFEPCAEGAGWLDPDGTTHELQLSWMWAEPLGGWESVASVARLVMNVTGPGRLDFASVGQVVLWDGCGGSTFVTHPIQIYAEAGIECGYISSHCGYHDEVCEPLFFVPQLELNAPEGGVADSTVLVRTYSYWENCSMTIDTHAPWCTASIEHDFGYDWDLHITADATALPPATYETAIELFAGSMGVARCLPVVLHVEQPTATSPASWGRVKSLYH